LKASQQSRQGRRNQGTRFFSADGKSRTVTAQGKDAEGKKISSSSVYDKQ
jgi:hypothetical protein